MDYVKTFHKERIDILEKLKPHFEKYGKLEICGDHIMLDFENGESYRIVTFKAYSINNDWAELYRNVPIKREDVFEEIGGDLEDLKIKPVPFNIEVWKKGFAKRHGLEISYIDNKGCVKKNYNQIIYFNNNTSYSDWHFGLFKLKHEKFNLNFRSKNVYLKTKEDCEEFERIYIIISRFLDELELPDLNDPITKRANWLHDKVMVDPIINQQLLDDEIL